MERNACSFELSIHKMGLDAFIANNSARHPKPASYLPEYGTAGFRTLGTLLDSTAFRCGILAALRSILLGKATGVMITASHNQVQDNGLKLVEPSGAMLVLEWERHAASLARCATDSELVAAVHSIAGSEGIRLGQEGGYSGRVILGRDTRPTSEPLLRAAIDGALCLGATAVDLGLTTTPQLHFAVWSEGEGRGLVGPGGVGAEDAYLDAIAGAFRELMSDTASPPAASHPLLVDCANGVGAAKLRALAARLEGSGLTLELRNTGAGGLNDHCGADFVQKERIAPTEFGPSDAGLRCCSVDGDADRLVYFSPRGATGTTGTTGTPVDLMDGDRIASLMAEHLGDLVRRLPAELSDKISVGVVQTAYANGASTAYLRDTMGLNVVWAKTGTKHMHAAAEHFPLGIYCEANGHGTALFQPGVLAALRGALGGLGGDQAAAARELLAFSGLINQSCGDSFSLMLTVEVILRKKGWGLKEWASRYSDLPSRQLKVTVPDRKFITCSEDESRAVRPPALQSDIDLTVSAVPHGRAFVRPSGTEDIVRVYAEAESQAAADALAEAVRRLVVQHAQQAGM